MGNKSLLIVLWGVGTGIAALVAWQSLSLVRASTETDALGNPGIDARVESTATAGSESSSDPSAGGATEGQATTSASDTGADPEPATSLSTTTSSSPTSSEASIGPGTDGASTTAEAVPQPSTTVASTDNSQDRTFNVIGGTAAVRFSPTEIMILWATPAPGFTADWHPEESGGMEIEFHSEDHKSKLEVWWANGPRFDVSEEDD